MAKLDKIPKKLGRPRKEIDEEQFKNLCGLQCTQEEIADFFNCSVDTVERWCKRELEMTFAEAFKKYSAKGKITLRRNQMKLSERSASMAIWLGKQMLGQEDKMTIHTVDESSLDELEQLVLMNENEVDENGSNEDSD